MNTLGRKLTSFLRDESGVAAIEYALILSLLVVGIIAVVGAAGNNVSTMFDRVDNAYVAP